MDARTPSADLRSHRDIPDYYGRPALKPSLYGWIVALYIFIGGLAAGVQILVTAAELLGVRDGVAVSLCGRAIALAGAILGGILLIADLHTKRRFYNMLRIFRPTSPMSIGTYALMWFGFWSLAAFVVQTVWIAWVATLCGVLASLGGWLMTTYTASLLAATATPLWSVAPRLLAVRFASSAMATGAAALCLVALLVAQNGAVTRALAGFAAIALIVQLIATLLGYGTGRSRGVAGPLFAPRFALLEFVGADLLGIIVPLVLYGMDEFSGVAHDGLLWPGSICVLAGGLLMRAAVLLAGNESARRPTDYFRLAQTPVQTP